MTRTILTTALAALALGSATLGTAGTAFAGGKHWHGGHGHWHHKKFFVYGGYSPIVYGAPCFKKKTFDKFGRLVVVKVCNYDYYGF